MKTIIILIGQKGSGKTFIGVLLNEKFGIHFIRIEDIFRQIKKDGWIFNKDYISEGFRLFGKKLNENLITHDKVCFETTGTAPGFDELLDRLKKEYRVILIKVDADSDLCLKRIKERDLSEHINVSDDDAKYINQISCEKHYDYDLVIKNNDKTGEEIVSEISGLIS